MEGILFQRGPEGLRGISPFLVIAHVAGKVYLCSRKKAKENYVTI